MLILNLLYSWILFGTERAPLQCYIQSRHWINVLFKKKILETFLHSCILHTDNLNCRIFPRYRKRRAPDLDPSIISICFWVFRKSENDHLDNKMLSSFLFHFLSKWALAGIQSLPESKGANGPHLQLHLALILRWNDADELIQIWLPIHSSSLTLMKPYLQHDADQNIQLGHFTESLQMWFVVFGPKFCENVTDYSLSAYVPQHTLLKHALMCLYSTSAM